MQTTRWSTDCSCGKLWGIIMSHWGAHIHRVVTKQPWRLALPSWVFLVALWAILWFLPVVRYWPCCIPISSGGCLPDMFETAMKVASIGSLVLGCMVNCCYVGIPGVTNCAGHP